MSVLKLSYSDVRANLAAVWDRVVENNEPAILHRRGSEDVVMIALSEFNGLVETAHLLRSPKNARRLLDALHQALDEEGEESSIERLAEEVGLGEAT